MSTRRKPFLQTNFGLGVVLVGSLAVAVVSFKLFSSAFAAQHWTTEQLILGVLIYIAITRD